MKLDPRALPTLLIVIDVLAAAGYIQSGDWRRIVYWLAAAALTYTVTW
jgi:hypothetical protein